MKYFLHDTDAFSDEKITELYLSFGYEGLGLFYTALEKMAKQEKPVKTSVLKAQLKVGKKLEKCWNFMESLGLISSNNGESFNKQLLNFSEKFQIKKEKNRKRISEWRKNQDIAENVTCYESVRNNCKVKESKVNRNKINKKSDLDFSIFNNSEVEIIKSWVKYRNSIKKPLTQNALVLIKKDLVKNGLKYTTGQIEQSIKNGWQGLFEYKEEKKASHIPVMPM